MAKENAGMLPIEAARRLGISLEHCYRLVWMGRLRATKINGRWRVSADSVEARSKAQKAIAALRDAHTSHSPHSPDTAAAT